MIRSDGKTQTEKSPALAKAEAEAGPSSWRWRLSCGLCTSVCLLARVVGRVDVIDFPRSYAVDLKNGFLIEEGEMGGLGLHDRYSAWWKPHDFGFIEVVTDPDIESSGHHRDMLNR